MPKVPGGVKQRLLVGLKNYLLSVALIWLAIFFYRSNLYYAHYLHTETQTALFYLALSYTILGLIFYILLPIEKLPKSKGYLLITALKRVATDGLHYLKNFAHKPGLPPPKLAKEEKVALLFVLVKLFFLPLMINFLIDNYNGLQTGLATLNSAGSLLTVNGFNTVLFPLIFSIFLFIDVAFFTFGYIFEAGFLRNKVRSVEPTALGWIVALICYPPFNGLLGNYVTWYPNDYVYFSTPDLTFVLRVVVLVLMGIYAYSSVALGTKASNLTNRGIVGHGPYKYVRHPAYISKNLAWWVTVIPIFSLPVFLSALTWSSVYFLRAITEERHLLKDPDYQAYCQKVPNRFIPSFLWPKKLITISGKYTKSTLL